MDSVNALSVALQGTNQQGVAKARSYAQSFTSIFGEQVPPSYIDLGNFVQLLKKQAGDSAVGQAADQVLADIGQLVIAEKHGPNKPGATGVAIYFPNSQLYAAPVAGPQSYTAVANRFAKDSLWDDFLAYHYTGRRFKPETRANLQQSGTAAVPQRGETITAPGAGPIVVSPIRLSDDVAAPGKPIVLTADIVGQKVGYVYLYAGYLDQASNSIFLADMDYLASPDTQEVGGTYYPVWDEDGRFTIKFKWEPLMFSITDGETSTLALLRPERYGASPEEAVYTVDGTYTYVDGESRQARLYFSNGVLHHVYGFTGDGSTGAPREILPNSGDTFTILETWLDQNGSRQAGHERHAGRQDPDLRRSAIQVEGAGRCGRRLCRRLHRDRPGWQQLRAARQRDCGVTLSEAAAFSSALSKGCQRHSLAGECKWHRGRPRPTAGATRSSIRCSL